MAQKSLSANVAQAISDFDGIRTALRGADVAVPDGTPTSSYGELVKQAWNRLITDTVSDRPTALTMTVDSLRSYALASMMSLMTLDLTISARSYIGNYTLYGCTALQSAIIRSTYQPSGMQSTGAHVFEGCIALSSVTLPDTVQEITAYTFSGCAALAGMLLPSALLRINNSAFFGCAALASIDIGSNIQTIAANAFSGCGNLTQITVHKAAGSIAGAPWGAANATVTWTE